MLSYNFLTCVTSLTLQIIFQHYFKCIAKLMLLDVNLYI